MDTLLKKAGAMLAHLDLFTHMLHLRGLLQLAAHMEERGDRVTLISPEAITLVGTDMASAPSVTTSKGATIEAGHAYRLLRTLKGHDAPEYAVTREELGALNARAVADLEASDAMRAFGETLARIGVPAVGGAVPAEGAPERPGRSRRAPEGEGGSEQPAA
ncbi:multidrug DMT transporter [Deinococcus sp. YIM 77859]|uniref:multidrug DMT transporter n=1 Tax=Deinococcus sp. YIM 77859 TaxID=1540221 RepID=UPI0005595B09|nr:multidrug DMT transporter [Deinococcus sp. YIM 77859]